MGRFVSADTLVPDPGNPQSLNRYSYSYGNPVKFVDPSGHWPAWFDAVLGGGYQFVNDMAWGATNVVFGTAWQDEQSAAFQAGQDVGRQVSTAAGIALTVDGGIKAGAGLAAMAVTAAGGAGLAPVTAGVSAAIAAPALLGEAAVAGTGLLEGGYGAGVLLAAARNPTQGPRYTENNFRANLQNRSPAPSSMSKPQAHHMLPKTFASEFNKLGINVHDPRWGAWVEGTPPGDHQLFTGRYNDVWRQWLTQNPGAGLQDVLDQAQVMAKQFGITWP